MNKVWKAFKEYVGFAAGIVGVAWWLGVTPEMVGEQVYTVSYVALPFVMIASGFLVGWNTRNWREERDAKRKFDFEKLMPDQKQMLHVMSDCAVHRIKNEENRKRLAVEVLKMYGYANWVDCDRDGAFFQLTPEARIELKKRSRAWELSKKADGIPDDSLFSKDRELEWREKTGQQIALENDVASRIRLRR